MSFYEISEVLIKPFNEEDIFNLRKAYDAFLRECQKLFVVNSKLASKANFFEKELNDLKLDRASFEESKVEKIEFLKKTKQLEKEKSDLTGSVDSLKKSNLDYEKKFKDFENKFST